MTAIHEQRWLRFDIEQAHVLNDAFATRVAIESAPRRPSLIVRVADDEEADQIVHDRESP